MTDDTSIRHGSRNLFADLGYADAETHLLKARLVARIREIISKRGLKALLPVDDQVSTIT